MADGPIDESVPPQGDSENVPPQGDTENVPPPGDTAPTPAGEKQGTWRVWRRRILWGGAGLIVLVILWFLAASFVPRWWAQRIGGLVDGAFSAGVLWGLFFGFVFTFIPLLICGLTLLRPHKWKVKVAIVVAALLLAIPNLMTLGIVLGHRNAAHAGERILDVEGPAFRGASLVGALVAAVLAIGIVLVIVLLRRRGREIKTLREQR